jgi:hypothetical protein
MHRYGDRTSVSTSGTDRGSSCGLFRFANGALAYRMPVVARNVTRTNVPVVTEVYAPPTGTFLKQQGYDDVYMVVVRNRADTHNHVRVVRARLRDLQRPNSCGYDVALLFKSEGTVTYSSGRYEEVPPPFDIKRLVSHSELSSASSLHVNAVFETLRAALHAESIPAPRDIRDALEWFDNPRYRHLYNITENEIDWSGYVPFRQAAQAAQAASA